VSASDELDDCSELGPEDEDDVEDSEESAIESSLDVVESESEEAEDDEPETPRVGPTAGCVVADAKDVGCEDNLLFLRGGPVEEGALRFSELRLG